MSYIIEITHANDVVSNIWKTVDRLESIEQIQDYIASPSFEWSAGTVVRVVGDEYGILHNTLAYNDRECVDVSYNSDAYKKSKWTYSGIERELLGRSIPSQWVHCSHAGLMFSGIFCVSPLKTKIDALCACGDLVMPYVRKNKEKCQALLNTVRRYGNGEVLMSSVADARKGVGVDMLEEVILGLSYQDTHSEYYEFLNFPEIVARELWTRTRQPMALGQKLMADEIRRQVPFLPVLMGYIR